MTSADLDEPEREFVAVMARMRSLFYRTESKKGGKSVGVQRQYSGTLGRIDPFPTWLTSDAYIYVLP